MRYRYVVGLCIATLMLAGFVVSTNRLDSPDEAAGSDSEETPMGLGLRSERSRSPRRGSGPLHSDPAADLGLFESRIDRSSPGGGDKAVEDKWAGIPPDSTGVSLGAGRDAFRSELVSDVRDELVHCRKSMPQGSPGFRVNMDLFVEMDSGKYRIAKAVANPETEVDVYVRRCLELAFERDVEAPEPPSNTSQGPKNYRLVFPLAFADADGEASASQTAE